MSRVPKVFLDTDLVLDFLLRREPHFQHAAGLLQAAMDEKVLLMASAGALQDIFHLARHAAAGPDPDKRGRETIRILLRVLEVCALDRQVWQEALASPLKDTSDALELACAARNRADFLVTRNLKRYAGSAHPQVISPDVMLATLQR